MSIGLLTSTLRVLNTLKDGTGDGYDRVSALVSSKLVHDEDRSDYSYLQKKKSRLEMVMLSCAVCGIEFCYAAETAFVTPTLLQIGVPIIYMSLIWGVSPMLGIFLVPVLGSLSDRCKSRLGRRRPFILLLSAGIILGLLLVPNGQSIAQSLGEKYDIPSTNNRTIDAPDLNAHLESHTGATATLMTNTTTLTPTTPKHMWGILLTIVGVVLLDFSCDSCQSPCRAYLLDVSIPEDHSTGLTTFTIMAGLGGSLGYVMGGINWENTSFGESLGGHVRVVFTLVLLIYIICLIITITSFKEIPLYKLNITKQDFQPKIKKVTGRKYRKFTNEDNSFEKEDMSHVGDQSYGSIKTNGDPEIPDNQVLEKSKTDLNCNTSDSNMVSEKNTNELNAAKETLNEFHEIERVPLTAEVSLTTYLKSIVHMPKSLIILCITNLFCWMSLVCYSLYFTDFVGQAVYGGDPSAAENSEAHRAYEDGVRLGSLGMSLYSISCSIYSLNIERLVRKFGARNVYMGSQLVYTFGALLMATVPHPVTVVLLSPASGIMYATLFTMPYLLVAHYHSNNTFTDCCENESRETQVRGLGTDIAIVSSMVFLAQFCLSIIMGGLVHATGTTSVVMITAAVLSFCGALAASQVMYLGL